MYVWREVKMDKYSVKRCEVTQDGEWGVWDVKRGVGI